MVTVGNSELEQLRRQVSELKQEIHELRTANADERAEQSQLLASREGRFRALFDGIDEGFCVIEFRDGPFGALSDYVHIEANPAYARHTGIPNVVGQYVRQMVPDEAEGWVRLYREVLVTGQSIRFERELVATQRSLELAAFRIEPASQRQVAVLFQDVTARKRAEAALQQLNATLETRVAEGLAQRKLLADIVDGGNALVQVADMNYRLLAINNAGASAFHRAFGVEPRLGENIIELLDGRPEAQAFLRRVWSRALSGEEFVDLAMHPGDDGVRRHYEMRFSPLRDETGRQTGAYQFIYDVTDRLAEQERLRMTEEALRQSQKMEAVGQLTGGIAHDFNNMLAIVLGSLRLAQRRLQRGELDIDKYIESAMAGADRGAKLVARLLAYSRRQALSPERADVNQLLGGMEDVLRRTIPESVRMEFVRAGGLWPVFADAHGLESTIVNLAVNARDAMADGGKMTIETANAYLDDAYAASHADVSAGQYVLIAVTDTGTGMAADVAARAFEPFFTTKDVGAGTGLGLSQVYGFVKQSGGHVKIYSEVGVGTTVKIYLPRLVEKTVTVPHPPAPAVPPQAGHGQLVLVVEDEDAVRRLTVEMVQDLGYAVLSANGAAAALSLLDQHGDVALLLSDVVMPDMNGRKLAAEAVRRSPGLKVLYTTGYTRNAIVHNGILDEDVELIVKPFTLEALAAKLTKLLGHS